MICAILGRGQSLKKYTNYCDKIDKVYMVNDFNDELGTIGLECFEGKKLTHVVGRGPNQLKASWYKKLGLKKVICNSFVKSDFKNTYPVKIKYLSDEMMNCGYPPVGMENVQKLMEKCDTYQEVIDLLDRKIKKGKLKLRHKKRRAWPTTAFVALDVCLVKDRPEKVYLFGIDFYRNRYMTKENRTHQTSDWYKSKAMMSHLNFIVKLHDKVDFYSSYSLDWDFDNWYNI